MSLIDLHSLATVMAASAFTGVCLWAFSRKRRTAFKEAANLPFADEEEQGTGSHRGAESIRTENSRVEEGRKD